MNCIYLIINYPMYDFSFICSWLACVPWFVCAQINEKTAELIGPIFVFVMTPGKVYGRSKLK